MKVKVRTKKRVSNKIFHLETVDINKEIKILKKKIPKDIIDPYQKFLAKKFLIASFYSNYSGALSEKKLVKRYNELKQKSSTSPVNNSVIGIAIVIGIVTSVLYTVGIGTSSEPGIFEICWKAIADIFKLEISEKVNLFWGLICKCAVIAAMLMLSITLIASPLLLLKGAINFVYTPKSMLDDMLIEEEMKIIKRFLKS